ncbi:MAG: PadR family transcriptional regulator [Thermoplasmatota archaeon]
MLEISPVPTTSAEEGRIESCNLYRGNLKLALLRCLKDGEMHGLDMINQIGRITKGEWVPSPGSVYPALHEFEMQGYISRKRNGRSILYSITEKGEKAFESFSAEAKNQLDFMEWIIRME